MDIKSTGPNPPKTATIKEKLSASMRQLRNYKPPFVTQAPDAISRKMGFTSWEGFNLAFQLCLRHSASPQVGPSATELMRQFMRENDPDDVMRNMSEYAYLHTTLKIFHDNLKGLRILQLACNYGPFLHFLQYQEGAAVAGIDIAKAAVEYARENRLDVRLGRANNLPFSSGEFDAVISKNFLCPIYINRFKMDEAKIVREIHRVLKPGGHFISDSEIFSMDQKADVSLFAFSRTLGPEFSRASSWFSMLRVMGKAA